MFVYDTKKREAPSRAPAKKHTPNNKASPYDGIIQRASMVGNSAMEAYLRQEAAPRSNALAPESGGRELPTSLRERFEARSGVSLDDVRVHYNSDKPAHLGALAYARGSEVHIGPGQEEHLEHELGHVVQQRLGWVQTTRHIGGISVNDRPKLEEQANNIETIQHESAQWIESTPPVVQCCRKRRIKEVTAGAPAAKRARLQHSDETERKKAQKLAEEFRKKAEQKSIAHGGAQSRKKVFCPHWATQEPKKREQHFAAFSAGKLAAMHTDENGKPLPTLRAPRSYADTPIKQRMRWLSTFLRQKCGTKTEIQCYYDASRNAVLVAANSYSCLNKLKEFQDENMVAITEKSKNVPIRTDATARDKRHITNMRTRGFQLKNGMDLSGAVITVVDSKTGIDGLHAERRIQKALAVQQGKTVDEFFLDPARLGGIHRPCTVCFHCIHSDEDRSKGDQAHVRPGPLWSSTASFLELTEAQVNRIREAISSVDYRTYATLTCDRRVTVDHDTDSDSDAESDMECDPVPPPLTIDDGAEDCVAEERYDGSGAAAVPVTEMKDDGYEADTEFHKTHRIRKRVV